MGKIKITKEEIKSLYEKGLSIVAIGKIAECNSSNIYVHLKRMNVSIRKNDSYRTYSINHNYFDDINTEEKAYILGFLYADGYNQESKNQIRITLNKKDIDILEKIKIELEYNKPLYKIGKDYLDLSINSKVLSKSLADIGCMQNKTFKIRFPNINKDFYRDFIRGYFDGDGCLCVTPRRNRPSKSYQFTLVGNKEFLIQVQNILIKELNLTKSKFQTTGRVYTMRYTGRNNFLKLTNYLYKNSNIYLDRKYNKYISTLNQ